MKGEWPDKFAKNDRKRRQNTRQRTTIKPDGSCSAELWSLHSRGECESRELVEPQPMMNKSVAISAERVDLLAKSAAELETREKGTSGNLLRNGKWLR